MADEQTGQQTAVEQKSKQQEYVCDCCGKKFTSNRVRQGEKLCVDCVELRRALKGFIKRGLSAAEVLKRGKKLIEPTTAKS